MPNMSLKRVPMPHQEPDIRNKNFSEVALGFTPEMAIEEASRCLNCKTRPCVSGCPVNVNIPDFLMFLVPEDSGNVPIILQLIMAELVIDGLKLASLNTPSVMSNSFGVIGGLLLGDFAVQVGWLSADVIFYMAIVSIASFTQSNYELGYALKFIRIFTLILTHFLNYWGFAFGILTGFSLIASNRTVNGERSYLYPLVPFNGRALARLVFRLKKP